MTSAEQKSGFGGVLHPGRAVPGQTALDRQLPITGFAFTSVRLLQLDAVVHLRLKPKSSQMADGLFTLHSVTGFRMPDGRLQLERIAGFCHVRHCLKTYWVEQIDALQDPDTSETIADLARWLAARPATSESRIGAAAQDAVTQRASARGDLVQTRQRVTVLRAIEKAIACAVDRGLDDVAARLTSIRETLVDTPSHAQGE
jgi:hypothetical protein